MEVVTVSVKLYSKHPLCLGLVECYIRKNPTFRSDTHYSSIIRQHNMNGE